MIILSTKFQNFQKTFKKILKCSFDGHTRLVGLHASEGLEVKITKEHKGAKLKT